MKYLVALLLGVVVGAALFVVGLVYNPFATTDGISTLSLTQNEKVLLTYNSVASDSIIYTNNGESRIRPHPDKVLQLWEAPIRKTAIMATVLRDGRNRPAGLGIKISSWSESTDVLNSEAIVDSTWHVVLPRRGSFFFAQRENRWGYLRDIVVRAYRNSGNSWKGVWNGNLTAGPGALRTASVSGSTGEFADLEMLGVESLTVKAWSAEQGEIAAEGTLIIELPEPPRLAAE